MNLKQLLLALLVFTLYGCKNDCITNSKCDLKPDAGPCYANFTKYYFDEVDGRCKEFSYGGCEGVVPFDSIEECKECECNNE